MKEEKLALEGGGGDEVKEGKGGQYVGGAQRGRISCTSLLTP